VPPTDGLCQPQPIPCGVTKPPTRLLFSIERMPMARHRPALASTGTAPDRRQLTPNFSADSGLVPAHQPALCLFTATRPTRLTVAPKCNSERRHFSHGATVSRHARSFQNRLAPSFYGSNLTPAVQPIAGGQGKLHYTPILPARNTRKTGR